MNNIKYWLSKNWKKYMTPNTYLAQDPKALISTNLYVGKIIRDRNVDCEVTEIHGTLTKTYIKVKILNIRLERLSSYLDIGKIYPVYKHSSFLSDKMQVWEIATKHLKQNSSQVLLYWELCRGWSWDLDF